MKKVVLATLIASALGASTAAFAGGTQTMAVSAAVTGTCKISSSTAMAFGTIDPSTVAADVTATGNIVYKCTNKTTPTSLVAVGLNDLSATSKQMKSGTDLLAYSISIPALAAGTGFGSGSTANTAAIAGTILLNDAQNAAAGLSYADTLTFTIAP